MEIPVTLVLSTLTPLGGLAVAAVKFLWARQERLLEECRADCREREAQLRKERDQAQQERRELERELALHLKSSYVLQKKLERQGGGSSNPPPSY